MVKTSTSLLLELKQQVELLKKITIDKRVFVGFDGFVDEIKKAVKQKKNFDNVFFKTMHEFSEHIGKAAGKSGQIEMITQRTKLGGNAPILSDALGKLGVKNFCVGSLGVPARHPVFSTINKNVEVMSLLTPGESDAIEFDDGKIIFSSLSVFDEYNWRFIKTSNAFAAMKRAILESDLIAFVDWVNLPHASDIWDGVLHDVIKPSGKKEYIFVFDLCDPSKKTTEQIDEVLDLMSSFSAYGKVTLGLNENETIKIWAALNGIDVEDSNAKIPSVRVAGDFIYKTMQIDTLLIHPIDRVIAFRPWEVVEMEGRLVKNPKVQTGGGDNLNAGYCLGLLSGFALPKCLLLAMAASGYYVEHGTGADLDGIVNYIDVWINDLTHETKVSDSPVALHG